MSTQKITLGLSVHRPEMTSFIADWMRRHDAIFLEEPPAAGFEQMLEGRLAVDDYLSPLDVEYPTFSREMCYLLRQLKAEGKKIFQVEPYLEVLLGIHEFFAEGHRPEELNKNSLQYPVYLAELSHLSYCVSGPTPVPQKAHGRFVQPIKLNAASNIWYGEIF